MNTRRSLLVFILAFVCDATLRLSEYARVRCVDVPGECNPLYQKSETDESGGTDSDTIAPPDPEYSIEDTPTPVNATSVRSDANKVRTGRVKAS